MGCEKKDATQPPQTAASTDQARYAEAYPEQVQNTQKRIDDGKAEVNEQTGKFASYPGELKDPYDGDAAAEVVRAADESGRSQAYVERARENEAVTAMFEENDGEINKKVAGGVAYTAEQQGCSKDLGGAAVGAMKRAMETRMKDRLKERNRAYEVIERNETKLGKDNVPTLQKQSDDIAYTSYVANIQLPTERAKLQRMINERSEVERSIDRHIEEEQRFQAQEGVSDADKKASAERVQKLEKAKADLASAQQYDQQQLEQMDKDIQATQEAYRTALDKLLGDLEGKPAPATASVEATAG